MAVTVPGLLVQHPTVVNDGRFCGVGSTGVALTSVPACPPGSSWVQPNVRLNDTEAHRGDGALVVQVRDPSTSLRLFFGGQQQSTCHLPTTSATTSEGSPIGLPVVNHLVCDVSSTIHYPDGLGNLNHSCYQPGLLPGLVSGLDSTFTAVGPCFLVGWLLWVGVLGGGNQPTKEPPCSTGEVVPRTPLAVLDLQ